MASFVVDLFIYLRNVCFVVAHMSHVCICAKVLAMLSSLFAYVEVGKFDIGGACVSLCIHVCEAAVLSVARARR